jgi:hypothetical protein
LVTLPQPLGFFKKNVDDISALAVEEDHSSLEPAPLAMIGK